MSRDAEYLAPARALAQRIAAYEPHDLQAVVAAREMNVPEPERVAATLAALIVLARQGHQRERVAVAAVGRALLSSTPEQLPMAQRSRLLLAAQELELTEVAALFISAPAAQSLDDEVKLRGDPHLAGMTLGHKKSLARLSNNPDLVARIAAEGDPEVIRQVLLNARLTEELVVRICARRPARAQTFFEVFAHRKWAPRDHVRRAMALNPYCPPEIALKLLPTFSLATLDEVAGDKALAEPVRQAALLLADRTRRGIASDPEEPGLQ